MHSKQSIMRIYMNQDKDTKHLVDLHRKKVRSRSKSKSKERQQQSKGKPPKHFKAKRSTAYPSQHKIEAKKDNQLNLGQGNSGQGNPSQLVNLLNNNMTSSDISNIAANADNLIKILQTLKQRNQPQTNAEYEDSSLAELNKSQKHSIFELPETDNLNSNSSSYQQQQDS